MGRPKGAQGKVAGSVKEMVLCALHAKGGVKYLEKQADLNPKGFMTLLAKIIPTTLAGDKENPVFTKTSLDDSDRDIISRYLNQKDKKWRLTNLVPAL